MLVGGSVTRVVVVVAATFPGMAEPFDFVVVGGGSAGAVVAARLSEDPTCRVALLEAGDRPPPEELMPAACPVLQLNPATDWMYTADAGGCGLGLTDGRMMVPRGKMLGGSSGINYMAYVRGHPGDFDSWAAGGATGWSYDDVLPYFKKSEGLAPSGDIVVDADAHNTEGPLGVSVRAPVLTGRAGLRRRRGGGRHPDGRLQRPRPRRCPTGSCRCCRRRPVTASGRARTTRSSKARSSSDRTSR